MRPQSLTALLLITLACKQAPKPAPQKEAPAAPARITPAHELELIDDEFAQAARFAGLDVPEPRPATQPMPEPVRTSPTGEKPEPAPRRKI